MNIKKAREILFRDPAFKKEYYKKNLAFEIAKILIEARIIKNVTQDQLAKLIGTKQPSIARIERGESLPSLGFLQRIAKALNTYLVPPIFGFMVKTPKIKSKSLNATQQTTIDVLKSFSTSYNSQYNLNSTSSCA